MKQWYVAPPGGLQGEQSDWVNTEIERRPIGPPGSDAAAMGKEQQYGPPGSRGQRAAAGPPGK